MRKGFLTSVFLIGFFLSTNLTPMAYAAETGTSLANKINKGGQGCTKITKVESILYGKRYSCISNGEAISIEVYSSKTFKLANEIACSFGMRLIVISDNKTWNIIPETKVNATKIAKALKTKVKILCTEGPIINEFKDTSSSETTGTSSTSNSGTSTAKSNSKGSINNPYTFGEEFVINGLKLQVMSIVSDATKNVCDSFKGQSIVPKLCDASYDSNLNIVVTVDPNTINKYVQWKIDVTNNSKEVANPENLLQLEMSTTSGSLISQGISYYESDLVNWSTRLVPQGKLSGNVFFEQKKDINISGLFLVIRSQDWSDNSTIYVKAS